MAGYLLSGRCLHGSYAERLLGTRRCTRKGAVQERCDAERGKQGELFQVHIAPPISGMYSGLGGITRWSSPAAREAR
jgi:hypothetical protein